MTCKHRRFVFVGEVARLENIGRFHASAKIHCADCGKPFQFLGLPAGVTLGGASVSVDGLELRIGICPQGEQPSPAPLIIGLDQTKLN